MKRRQAHNQTAHNQPMPAFEMSHNQEAHNQEAHNQESEIVGVGVWEERDKRDIEGEISQLEKRLAELEEKNTHLQRLASDNDEVRATRIAATRFAQHRWARRQATG